MIDAGCGGTLLPDGRFIKIITAPCSNERARNYELRITGRFGEEFYTHLHDPATGDHYNHAVVRFLVMSPETKRGDRGTHICELRRPQGQPYLRFGIPKDEQDDYIITFLPNDVYTVARAGYVVMDNESSLPALVVILYSSDLEGVLEALREECVSYVDLHAAELFPAAAGMHAHHHMEAEEPSAGGDAALGQPANGAPRHENGAAAHQHAAPVPGQEQQNQPAGPIFNLPAGELPLVSTPAAGVHGLVASPLNINDPGLPPEIQAIVAAASSRWLNSSELNSILQYFNQIKAIPGIEWPTHAAKKPKGELTHCFILPNHSIDQWINILVSPLLQPARFSCLARALVAVIAIYKTITPGHRLHVEGYQTVK